MGFTSYSSDTRAVRAKSLNYAATHAQDTTVFKQNAARKINEGMDPAQITLRECRDSEAHPCTVPIILGLDVTGSMGRIPAQLVASELPHLMTGLIDGGCPDASLLFMAVGDQYADDAPLQVGQFESGDAELDHWLTTCWLEGNGGGNGGESYSLPWLFALNTVKTDAWDKRKERGLIITIGDEPLHHQMDISGLRAIFGPQLASVMGGLEGINGVTTKTVYHAASVHWNIHHVQVGGHRHDRSWEMLGENLHRIDRDASPVETLKKIVFDHMRSHGKCAVTADKPTETPATASDPVSGDEQPPQDHTPADDLPAPL